VIIKNLALTKQFKNAEHN